MVASPLAVSFNDSRRQPSLRFFISAEERGHRTLSGSGFRSITLRIRVLL